MVETRRVYSLIVVLLMITTVGTGAIASFNQLTGIDDSELRRVAVSPINSENIAVASSDAVYLSEDGGETFREIVSFTENINHLIFDSQMQNVMYVATSKRVYQVQEDVERQIFEGNQKGQPLSVEQHRGRIYVGTSKEVYEASASKLLTAPDELNWTKVDGLPRETGVSDIEPAEERIYFATSKGVYALNVENDQVERLYQMAESVRFEPQLMTDDEESDDGESDDADVTDIVTGERVLPVLKVDMFDQNTIYLGTNQGIFRSTDRGRSWSEFIVQGIGNKAVTNMVQSQLKKDVLYVGTVQGLFQVNLEEARAEELYQGLTSSVINWVDVSASGKVFVATQRGAFRSRKTTLSLSGEGLGMDREIVFGNEPSIQQVQQAAMRYNHVHPRKIQEWYEQAEMRDYMPEVDLDYSQAWQDELQNSGALTRDQEDYDWGVTATWDLRNLVWNEEKTSIDSRNRLATQLRLDILEEVNRIYFERLRQKKRLMSEDVSEQEKTTLRLRIHELTSILDMYTGGYFSRQLKN